VNNGSDALEYARTGEYDGIILDIMMPGLDGTEVLKRLRASGNSTPVLFLTAKGEIGDRIRGLDLGADDYLPKPFDMGELLARIRAMIRRKDDFSQPVLACGNVSLDRATCELIVADSAPVRLTAKEFQMMEMLLESPGRVQSPDSFLNSIWPDGEADVNTVRVYISNLRKKLKSLGANIELKSTRGLGYFVKEISDTED
jgi:DNA-binding response OmpR family regulator